MVAQSGVAQTHNASTHFLALWGIDEIIRFFSRILMMLSLPNSRCVFHAMADSIPASWRTPFHAEGGQQSKLMADT